MSDKYVFDGAIDLDAEMVLLPDGRRYTEADAWADSLAVTQHPPVIGRPSLSRGVSPLISFRAPSAYKERLAAAAAKSGRSQADIAREAFGRGLDLVAA
ncbi:MAG: hypothetical protein LBC29_01115 [Propionibacteriaceae bacterium]|jgi:hypothetical protein|nr:hypothetical protein [Propionibacteriaceae bacterium]